LLEERAAEGQEEIRSEPQHGGAGFVGQGRGGVPGLDLLPEDGDKVVAVGGRG